MSLLSIVDAILPRIGFTAPGSAASNPDQNVQQLVALINEAGQELRRRTRWQVLRLESSFLTTAVEDQGSILTLAGPDFDFLVNDSMWNRTQRRPCFGPKSPQEWQQLKAQFMQGPWVQFIIRGNHVLFLPVPAAGQSIFFEWTTVNWCTDLTGVTGKTAMTVDTDIAKLDESLLTLDARWRFKQAKKLDWQGDFDAAESAIVTAIGRDESKPRLNLLGYQTDIFPAVVVPAGKWGL